MQGLFDKELPVSVQLIEKKMNKNPVRVFKQTVIEMKEEQIRVLKDQEDEPTYAQLIDRAWEFYFPFRELTDEQLQVLSRIGRDKEMLTNVLEMEKIPLDQSGTKGIAGKRRGK